MKRLLCLLIPLAVIISFAGCREVIGSAVLFYAVLTDKDERADKQDIFDFVENNYETLMSCIESSDYSPLENEKIIKQIRPNDKSVDFYCGGCGFASSTSYRGFFYSENDDVKDIWCAPPYDAQLKESDPGVSWYYKTPGTDNTFFGQKIKDKFFYYDASY